jgi:hypothetical protein
MIFEHLYELILIIQSWCIKKIKKLFLISFEKEKPIGLARLNAGAAQARKRPTAGEPARAGVLAETPPH